MDESVPDLEALGLEMELAQPLDEPTPDPETLALEMESDCDECC